MEYLNATAKYIPRSTWGYQNNVTGDWNGVVSDFIHDVSDFAGSPMFIRPERFPHVDFIGFNTKTDFKFVFRSPKLSITDNVFLLPFDVLVWCSLLGLITVTATCLLVALIAEWKHPLEQPVKQRMFSTQIR